MSWKSTIAKKPTWKDSIMRSKPITPDDLKSEVLKLVMPEIKEKTSWKNTLSIIPKNGRDGLNGKDGKSIKGPKGDKGDTGPAGKDGVNGTDGRDGVNGTNGSQILFLDKKPTDQGNDGDLVLINKTFEVFYKENGEWIKKGTLLGKSGATGYVGGLNGTNGLSAYEIAVKNGFTGTEVEWLASLGGSQVEYSQIIDEVSATVTYVGKAEPGSLDSAPAWQIKKITVSGTETIITWADGNANFDNVWNDRASLTFN